MSDCDIDNKAHGALIGSQVRCIKNYLADFLQSSPECEYREWDGCEHPDCPIFHCKWDSCPLQ